MKRKKQDLPFVYTELYTELFAKLCIKLVFSI